MILYSIIIVLIMLGSYMFYRYTTWPEPPLSIVDNKIVAAKIVTKLQYSFRLNSINKSDTIDFNSNQVTAVQISTTPAKAGNLNGENKKIFLRNLWSEPFIINGLSFFSNKRIPKTTMIIQTITRVINNTDDIEYKGNKLELKPNNEIEFTGIQDYNMERIIISINNAKPRPLNLTVIQSNNIIKYVNIIDLLNGYLIIDLYE